MSPRPVVWLWRARGTFRDAHAPSIRPAKAGARRRESVCTRGFRDGPGRRCRHEDSLHVDRTWRAPFPAQRNWWERRRLVGLGRYEGWMLNSTVRHSRGRVRQDAQRFTVWLSFIFRFSSIRTTSDFIIRQRPARDHSRKQIYGNVLMVQALRQGESPGLHSWTPRRAPVAFQPVLR